MEENKFDITGGIRYNTDNDENVEIVRMEGQRPTNDVSCRHETLTPYPDDTIGTAIYHGCSNRKCGVGFYIRPYEDKK